jgi:hypothetical protein
MENLLESNNDPIQEVLWNIDFGIRDTIRVDMWETTVSAVSYTIHNNRITKIWIENNEDPDENKSPIKSYSIFQPIDDTKKPWIQVFDWKSYSKLFFKYDEKWNINILSWGWTDSLEDWVALASGRQRFSQKEQDNLTVSVLWDLTKLIIKLKEKIDLEHSSAWDDLISTFTLMPHS